MTDECVSGNLLFIPVRFPDIAHYTTAITCTVGHEYYDRQSIDLVCQQGGATLQKISRFNHIEISLLQYNNGLCL